MKDKITVFTILSIYEKEIYKNMKNKQKIVKFERHKMENIIAIKKSLFNLEYKLKRYTIFVMKEPKYRVIMSLHIQDKIMNHFIAKYVLLEKLEKYLSDRNIATRKNKGTDYGIGLIKKDILSFQNEKELYCLKIDIKKYFYNIDHQVLKILLKNKVDDFEYVWLCKIIDSTNASYINEKIKKLRKEFKCDDLPFYHTGKGLPIGNMTSQFLAIFYLYPLDHFIIHHLRLKHYIRYMDDFIIFSSDKKKLQNAKKEIESILNKDYFLNINPKKTNIINIKQTYFSFLGYSFKLENKKLRIKLSSKTMARVKKNIKKKNKDFKDNKISLNTYFACINNYRNSFQYAHTNKIKNYISRYF